MLQKNRRLTAAFVSAAATGAVLVAAPVVAGPEKIAFPQGYETWERYAVVDRHDTKQYRELYAKPEIVKAAREGKPLPNGTVLAMAIFSAEVDDKGVPVKDANGRFRKGKPIGVTVMEKRAGWGADYPEEWRNANWEYASFLPDGNRNEKAADTKPCFVCHKPHAGQDYVISLASLNGKFPTAKVAAKMGAMDVNIASFSFGPGTLKVKAGQAVTWTNTDDSPHQVSIVGKPQKTGVLLKGQSEALKFDTAGTYGYICGLHPGMKGTVEVE